MKIDILFSKLRATTFKEVVFEISQQNTWKSFDDRAIKFVNKFSSELLNYPGINNFPDLVALAYWFRKSKIKKLSQNYLHNKSIIRTGKGLAFHVSPSNVDTIFIYSFFISLLSGNYNLIRVSRKSSDQIKILLEIFEKLSEKDDFQCAKRFVICTYEHDTEITSFFSKNSDIRILWGGDESVQEISSYQLKPTASEIKFPDRTSFSIINLSKIKDLKNTDLEKLAIAFYKDIELFGQQACSSPKAVFFIGKESERYLAKSFTDTVNNLQIKKIQDSQNMNRYVSATSMSIQKIIDKKKSAFNSGGITFLEGKLSVDKSFRDNHFGEGMVIEYYLEDLNEIGEFINSKDQTISVFGFSNEEIFKFIDTINNRGVDRIVPIGASLEFDHVWDGQDLFNSMSRIITISSNI